MIRKTPLWHPEIYKGKSKKYKEKLRSEDFFRFNPSNYLFSQFGIYICIPEVQAVLLTPILTYVCQSYILCQCVICVINAINVFNDKWQMALAYIWQYRSQKNCLDLRNAAIYPKLIFKLYWGVKIGDNKGIYFSFVFLRISRVNFGSRGDCQR